ncbi:hybrid sensor histidine kinase/response regulator [Lysobacter capsici]|uniref:hybrid sensor histidine kinase/response regulator n=1 Tax=Lysobacter capsici TaxID=435897 RepID=UPI00287B5F82|nr:hybrid sensor histidine kinase/response regulator [Lysobacter capsici]WND83040.1 hybrid sensor histidine kinase/response regulator [Lysobacter capsici]WND88239.1 hybrid sensor histidine kinase/response regulator [Lysobacter capsici]
MSTGDLRDFSLHDLFRMEVDGQAQLLTDGLLVLEGQPDAAAQLESCMRAAHSVKGAARVVGLSAAVTIAHAMEDCLVAAQEHRLVLDHAAIDALFNGVDLLSRIAATPAEQAEPWMRDDAPEAKRYCEVLAQALRSGVSPARESAAAPHTQTPLANFAQADTTAAGPSESHRTEPPRNEVVGDPIGEERVLRITARSLNRLLGLAGESLVASRWLDPYIHSLGRLKRLQGDSAAALDRLAEVAPSLARDQHAAALLAQARSQIAESQRLLADRIAQLDLFERRTASVAHRLYDEALSSHMRPFADGTRGFKRMVRDLARELGKQAQLEIAGAKTQVDRDVLARLEAPLAHLLRNAVDHGIESAQARRAAGKPDAGTIRLEAHHVSGLLEIVVEDDGRGIDLERIRETVVVRRLTDADTASRLSPAELMEFLFLPGFTLREVVTEISGRGVGLDAVQTMVKELRGSVRLSSRPGGGSRFQLQLPLTTSVLRGLVVEIGGEPYAFPLTQISSTAMVPREQVQWLEGRQHFQLNTRSIGLVSAAQVLGGAESQSSPEHLQVIVVAASGGGHEYGLAVERFIGVNELVVQPLPGQLGKVKDISAGALLDDGTPVLIVDVDDLVRSVERLVSTGRLTQLRYHDHAQTVTRKRVLVVDDSLTVRELERKLIENGGYAVEVAVDGMDGWNAVRSGHFDLVVTDIDMPRMDGIELVGLIKKDPRLRALPVMIVSYKDREEDRRRGLDAGADFYLTKGGFHEEALLQAVVDLIGEASA